jgi:hypothetical protein
MKVYLVRMLNRATAAIMSYYRMMAAFCAATADDKVLGTGCVQAKGEVVSAHYEGIVAHLHPFLSCH